MRVAKAAKDAIVREEIKPNTGLGCKKNQKLYLS